MGFFAIDRELLTHELWLDDEEPFCKRCAWVDLIGLANHTDTKLIVRGKVIEAKRGDVNRSFRWLADRWGWSVNKVRRFVDFLEAEHMVEHHTEHDETVLTLCNYCSWQDKYRSNGTPNGTPTEQGRNTNGTPTEHEQQYKQLNNINNPTNSYQEINKGESRKTFELPPELRARVDSWKG